MNYKLYQSKEIQNNYKDFVTDCHYCHEVFTGHFDGVILKDTTWTYSLYNIFNLTSTSILFYNLFKELNSMIRDYVGNDKPLWLESWLNFHNENEVLKKHHHEFAYHGYISIDPKNTSTVFPNFEIQNKIGQVYIGPGGTDYTHYVKVNKPFTGKRITIAFNLHDQPNKMSNNLGLMPIL